MANDVEGVPYPHPLHRGGRQPVYAANGMVVTSQPLAAQAGLAVLHGGGNAVDAAVAMAVALTVVEPASCGMGGDAFALVWDGQELHGQGVCVSGSDGRTEGCALGFYKGQAKCCRPPASSLARSGEGTCTRW